MELFAFGPQAVKHTTNYCCMIATV